MQSLRFFLHQNKTMLIILVGLTCALCIGQIYQNHMVFDRAAIHNGYWWKALSGHFTHSNIPHLLLNLSGIWLLALLFIDSLKVKTFIFSIVFLSFFVGAGLFYFTPEINRYYGFSGVLYGLYIVAASGAMVAGDKFTGLAVVGLIMGKVIWDFITGGGQSSAELIGVPVANDAHLYGCIGALILSMCLQLKTRFIANK